MGLSRGSAMGTLRILRQRGQELESPLNSFRRSSDWLSQRSGAGERKSLARPPPILLEFNHFDDRIGGRFVSPRVEPPKRRLVRGATRRFAIPLLSTIRSTLPHQLPPRRNGGPSGRLHP